MDREWLKKHILLTTSSHVQLLAENTAKWLVRSRTKIVGGLWHFYGSNEKKRYRTMFYDRHRRGDDGRRSRGGNDNERDDH